MKAPNSPERGTTLIELLIAITLLSLLSVGMLLTIRVGLNAMEKTNARVATNRRTAGAQHILEREISGLMPVVAECMGPSGQPSGKDIFFQGEPQTMRFVSSYSLSEGDRGYPRILEFQVIPAEQPDAVRLIVNEHIYSGPRSAGVLCVGRGPDPRAGQDILRFRPVQVGANSFVLADNLAYCRMSYMRKPENPEQAPWVPIWTDKELLPRAVRIEMAPNQINQVGMPPLTLTAPVRVLLAPLYPYKDWWESPGR